MKTSRDFILWMCLVASGLLLGGVAVSYAEVLAVSHVDFSTAAQGTNGVFYGYYDGPDSTTHVFVSGAGQMQSGMSGSLPAWYRSGSGANLPNLVPYMQHPGPSGEGAKNVVRRYVVGEVGEPPFTGTVRVVGRFFDLDQGSTNVFLAVDTDGDAGVATRSFPFPSSHLVGPTPKPFDFTAAVSPGATIDIGVMSNGDAGYDTTGVVAWIVTEDVAVPTHAVANSYSSIPFSNGSGSQESRGLVFALVTDGVLSGIDEQCFDTSPAAQYTHSGLLYSENLGSGKVTKFNSVRIDVNVGGDFAEPPHLFLLRHNSDPGSINPAQDERYVQLPVTPVRTAANSVGEPYWTFDLSSLPETQRTGYGFTIMGRGNTGAIAVSEISADAVRVSDAGHVPAWPAWTEYNGHRYALSFTRGTWEQTEAEALSYGGHLVSINSEVENEWVFDAFGRGANTYIGLRQNPLQSNVEPGGGWTWMDGTVLNLANGDVVPGVYANWNDGRFGGNEPNHAYGAGEDYATFAPSVFGGRSVWGDIKNAGFPETSNYRGIIELTTVASPGNERNLQFTVSGQANIFGAGQDNPTPSVNPGTGGVAAPWRTVYAGEKVRITASSGSVSTASETSGVDGTHHPTKRCDITGVGGISGYLNGNNSAHLVGVFVGSETLSQTPERIDFSANATGEAFATLSPGIGQVFFIGDGLTPGGKVQEFVAPEGAVRLYLGVPDAYRSENPDHAAVYVGPPNAYADNTGSWSVRMAVTPSPTPQFVGVTLPDVGGQLTGSGGTGPYEWTVVSGDLPPHLAIETDGSVVSASQPRANGRYVFTLRLTDDNDLFVEKQFTVVVEDAIPAPAGLAAWWPGQNTVADIIGGDHLIAAPSSNFGYATGKSGRAFHFNGNSQSLQTAVATDVMKHLPLTIEAWIKPEARTTGNLVSYLPTNVIANDRINFGGHGFGAHLYPDGSMLRVGMEGVGAGEGLDFHIVPNVTFTDGVWVHVAVVYTEGNVKTYLDGELKDDFDYVQGPLDGGDIIRVGRHNDDTGYGDRRFFKGAIDEISIYHAELDESQVQSLYMAGTGGKKRNDAGLEFNHSGAQSFGAIWTYGSTNIDTGSIVPSSFALHGSHQAHGNGIVRYYGPSEISWNSGSGLVKEMGQGGTWIHTLPKQLRMHPGGSHLSTLRWTAPEAARYAVSASFAGADEHGVTTDVHVYHNTLPMTQTNGQAANGEIPNNFVGNTSANAGDTLNIINGNAVSFTGVIDAQEGDTVDFMVGPNGSPSYDNTGTFASVVYLGPVLEAPANLAIDTDSPPKIGRMWFFETEFNAGAFVDPELRIQYAEANTPNNWQDIDAQDGTNRMTPPAGNDVWTLPVFLDVPVGNYRFRVVASAAGYSDKAGPAFGVEAMGEPSTDPFALSAPGQPPPPPPPQPMPAASKMTFTINGKSVTTAKQGQVAKFVITQPLPAGTPEPDIEVEWSTTPADDNSWEGLDNQDIVYNKAAKTWTVTATHLPAANGVYFRTLTKGKTRLATPGPVVSNVLKLVGPVNISPGALWRYATVSYKTSSDNSGDTANTGDTITYTLTFKNEGAAPATNVQASIAVPTGTELLGGTSQDLFTSVTSANRASIKRLEWRIPSMQPDTEVVKELTVRIKTAAGTKITLPSSGVTVKCAEIPALKQADLIGRSSRKVIETMVFSSLRLSLEASEVEDDDEPVASIAKMGQVIYYTLKAENRSASAVTNANASLRIPLDMTLEYVRLRDGNNDFVYTKLETPSPTSNPSVTPHVYKGQQLITWFFESIPANTTRTMKFALRVMFDLPSTRIENGVYVTNSIVIDDYNITAKAGTKTIRAFASKGAPVTALLTDERYSERAPNLVLTKTALADGQAFGSHSPVTEYLPSGQRNPLLLGTSLPGIGGVAAPHKGTRITYTLNWANKYYPPPLPGQSSPDYRPPASARNAVIREEIPANTTFVGFLRRNDAPLASSLNITFRTKDGYEIPSGGEPWTDTNSNGKADRGEYTDTNGNKRYDAFTDTRYIDYRLGNLPAGASGKLTYDVIATGAEGDPIVSRAEGAMIPAPVGGMYYKGYSIWCENRHQAGTATPEKLVSMISRPVEIVQPVITGETPADLQPRLGQRFKLEIGYGVKGVVNSGLQDFLLTVTVPKPFILVPSAATPAPRTGMVNSALPIGATFRALRGYHADQNSPSIRRGESAPIITSNNTETVVVFKLGGLIGGQSGAVGLELQLPADLPKSLFDAEGYLKLKSYEIRAEMSHKKVGSIQLRPASGMVVIEPALIAPAASPSARNTPFIGGLLKPTTQLFLGRTYPLSARPGGSFDMMIFFGNATNTTVQGGKVIMAIPPGLTRSYYSPVVYYYTGATPAQDNLLGRYEYIKESNGVLTIDTLDMPPHTMGAVQLTFDVAAGFSGNTIEDGSLSVTSQNSGTRTAIRMCIGVQRDNFFSNLFNAVLGPIFNGLSEAVARLLRPANEHLINANSRYLSIVGADIVQLSNGSIIVPLKGGRVAAIGSVNYVHALDGNNLLTDGSYRITVAHQSVANFRISGINTSYRSGETWNPHDILAGIGRGGIADLVAAGGGNLVAAGGLNLIGNDGSTLINNNTGAALAQVAFRAPTMVAAGGGNMVAAGGGNMVAAGAGNLIGMDGSTLIGNDGSTLIGMDGSTLIGMDGSTFKMATTNLVAAGAGNMVAAGAGNMVAAGAGNMVAAGGLNFSATATSSLISSNASSIVAGKLAGSGLMESIARSQFIGTGSAGGILSHNGGQILSHNGGLIRAP